MEYGSYKWAEQDYLRYVSLERNAGDSYERNGRRRFLIASGRTVQRS